MVVLAWVDDQVAEDLAGGGVHDGDVQVIDEQDDVGSGVGSADADVAESAGDAQDYFVLRQFPLQPARALVALSASGSVAQLDRAAAF